jgi:hypothetical protein
MNADGGEFKQSKVKPGMCDCCLIAPKSPNNLRHCDYCSKRFRAGLECHLEREFRLRHLGNS